MHFPLVTDWLEQFRNPWPDAKPLPRHVREVQLDRKIMLHIDGAHKPSERVQVGWGKQ